MAYRNPYGVIESRVDIVDNFELVRRQYGGYVVDLDRTPLSPKNRAMSVTAARMSPSYSVFVETGPPRRLHPTTEKTALTADDSAFGSPASSIAFLAADTTNQALAMVRHLGTRVGNETSLRVLSEEEISNSLPLYPATLDAEGNFFSDRDTALLVEIGNALGVDYVYAVRRMSASMTHTSLSVGHQARFRLNVEGVLVDVSSEDAIGQTRFFAHAQAVTAPLLEGSRGLQEAIVDLETEASHEIADAVAERIIELAAR